MSFYKGGAVEKSANDCFDAVEAALKECGILTPNTLMGALATVRVEVGRKFLPIEEIASGRAYEGRIDLGNYCPGDGMKYKGRGFIQLTGRDNYQNYGDEIGVDLICHPEEALEVKNSAKILALYFLERKVNKACDVSDWVRVRKLVNGGANGLTDFLKIINQYNS